MCWATRWASTTHRSKGVDWVFVDHPSYPRPGGIYADAFGVYGDNQVLPWSTCCPPPNEYWGRLPCFPHNLTARSELLEAGADCPWQQQIMLLHNMMPKYTMLGIHQVLQNRSRHPARLCSSRPEQRAITCSQCT